MRWFPARSMTMFCCALAALAGPARAAEQPVEDLPFSITRLDPELDRIIAPDAHLDLLGDSFGLIKGLQWIDDGKGGYLIVSDLISNVLYKVAPDRKVSAWLTKAGYTGADISHAGTQTMRGRAFVLLVGSSCSLLDGQGRLVWCANNDRSLMRLEPDGSRTVLASGSEGKRFSGPNSIAIRKDGGIYLTDNDFGLRDAGDNPDKQMPNAVWLVRDGKPPLKILDRDALGGLPDGVALSPDEAWLYLSAESLLKRYQVKPDGGLGTGEVIGQGDGIGDGIAADRNGNIFSTGGFGRGRIRIMSASGKLLGFINLPVSSEEPRKRICSDNVAFGGPDGKTLYIAACQALFKIPVLTAGIAAGPQRIVQMPVPKEP